MKLNIQNLYIDPAKLKDYLLNPDHIDGRSKAKLLISLGFNVDYISKLHDSILLHAAENDFDQLVHTKFGEKYLVEGNMTTPNGKILEIRSVWIKERQEEIIKFVILYPL